MSCRHLLLSHSLPAPRALPRLPQPISHSMAPSSIAPCHSPRAIPCTSYLPPLLIAVAFCASRSCFSTTVTCFVATAAPRHCELTCSGAMHPAVGNKYRTTSALNASEIECDANELYVRCTILRNGNFESKTKKKWETNTRRGSRTRRQQNIRKRNCAGPRRGYELSR